MLSKFFCSPNAGGSFINSSPSTAQGGTGNASLHGVPTPKQGGKKEKHSLNIEGCASITATAIDEVCAFSSSEIALLCGESKLVIAGSDLKISNFSKESGAFSATGHIHGVKYVQKHSLAKRLFS